ncbi:MAG TPA: hypothetical protein VHC22_13980 [Pirellulales bacterium]|nr:hypothetical protein [Pirellulales bacterium]
MRRFCFLAVAAAALALVTSDQAQAGGRRARYYSYGGSSSGGTVTAQRSVAPAANTAQSNTIRRYSYSPTTGSASGYSYSNNRTQVMGLAPYTPNPYWRADRKVKGY